MEIVHLKVFWIITMTKIYSTVRYRLPIQDNYMSYFKISNSFVGNLYHNFHISEPSICDIIYHYLFLKVTLYIRVIWNMIFFLHNSIAIISSKILNTMNILCYFPNIACLSCSHYIILSIRYSGLLWRAWYIDYTFATMDTLSCFIYDAY